MIDEFITFFMAGQETTANTLSFCLIEIAKNPLILKKLREEIDSVLGNRNVITIDDLNKLEYLSCVIKETLRKWPPANLPMRQVNTNEFKINGISIPYGALLHVNLKFCLSLLD
jgi:cholesterol 24(S)-hydroxylase